MLRKPFVIKLIARIVNALLKVIYITCRVKAKGLEHFNGKNKLILMFWHNRIAMAPAILHDYKPDQNFAAFVSNSRDGAYLAEIIHSYQQGQTIRVPHDLRHEALRQAVRQIKGTKDIVIITPDGPRGPRYEVKGGIVLAAKRAGASIIPMSWNASRFWEFKTWDRLILPKPFSTIEVTFGNPITLDGEKLEVQILKLQQSLEALESARSQDSLKPQESH